MTILGKILVIANLVFSLVTGALIITVYATRTNWAYNYGDLRKKYDLSEANVRTLRQEVDESQADAERRVKDKETTLNAQIQAGQAELNGLRNKLVEYQTIQERVKVADANLRDATAETDRRRTEIDNLRKRVAGLEDKITKLEDQSHKLRDDAVAAQIAARSAQERNQMLLQQLQEMSREAARPTSTTPTGTTARPPAEDVEGQVVQTGSGLVTVSIGTDQGLKKGDTLEVFRLQPRPEYLGRITILDARAHEAVARPVPPVRGEIQKGDIVASRIMANPR